MKKSPKEQNTKNTKNKLLLLNKIYFELEGGSIYTLKNVCPEENVVSIKRMIKSITGIQIGRQILTVGRFTMKDSTKINRYPLAEETTIKVFYKID